MNPTAHDWLSLVLRWAHVIAGITWIGHALFFNWLDASLEESEDDDVEGDLWMVHSGGFYEVRKLPRVPAKILERMHWFKWEAAFTWISGFLLLGVVYYMGGAALMIDKSVHDLGSGAAIGIGIGSLVGAWLVYDLLWMSPLGRNTQIGAAMSFALLIAAAYGLTQLLSGRAAYLHVGAIMGTCMVANVWMRIIPAQKQLVAATKDGSALDPTLANRAKYRSRHNNYMTYPLIFIMISNHYYHTFSAEQAWLILALVFIGGAGVRHIMNLRGGFSAPAAVVIAIAGAAAIYLTLPKTSSSSQGPRQPVAQNPGAKAIDAATVGTVRGVVSFEGTAPQPRKLTLVSECSAQHDGPVYLDSVLAADGKLQNVFVSIKSGYDGWKVPEPPSTEVSIDQSGCLYRPRVVGVQAGQPLVILNSDPLLHNVHTQAKDNDTFNQAMPQQGTRLEKTLWEREKVHVKCDVHPWMSAYIGVEPHPWFAVTDAAGAFTLENVPPGEYVVEAWHEVYGTKTATVTVAPKASALAAFSFSP